MDLMDIVKRARSRTIKRNISRKERKFMDEQLALIEKRLQRPCEDFEYKGEHKLVSTFAGTEEGFGGDYNIIDHVIYSVCSCGMVFLEPHERTKGVFALHNIRKHWKEAESETE